MTDRHASNTDDAYLPNDGYAGGHGLFGDESEHYDEYSHLGYADDYADSNYSDPAYGDPVYGADDYADDSPSGATPAAPRTRREARELEQQRSRRRRRNPARAGKRAFFLILVLAVVAAAMFGAYKGLKPLLDSMGESNDYPGPGTGSVSITVEPGDTGTAIGQTLVKADVVKSVKAYVDAVAADPLGDQVQPGTYVMKKQMNAAAAVAWLVDPSHRKGAIVIPEGLWKSEIYARLAKATGTPVAEYVAAEKDPTALGLPASAKGNVEGYLFPGGYDFPKGMSAQAQLKAMIAKSVAQLNALGVRPTDMERVVIIGSLVEAEASRAEDRPKVARVIENRLQAQMPLQFDSTVNFIFGKHHIATTAAMRADKSPYNTYLVKGLPPGPIGNPGLAALKAAAQPATGDWTYFVTVDPCSGETLFSSTKAEHDENARQFQQWLKDHPGGTCS